MADSRIPLSKLIAELRRELEMAQSEGQEHHLRLQVEEAEIELQVVVTQEEGAGIGVKFWVLNADLTDKLSDATTQKIRLKLIPTDDAGRRVKIRSSR